MNLYCHETVPDPLQFSSNEFFNQSINEATMDVKVYTLHACGYCFSSLFQSLAEGDLSFPHAMGCFCVYEASFPQTDLWEVNSS